MKELISGILALVLAAPMQRIETERPDRGTVKHVETAMNHLTVIEVAEPVVMAAAGSPSFKIERQGNKVLIQPLEDGASTNLFIWTASGRFSYELVPAASVDTMHFAIDQQVALRTQAPPIEKQIDDQELGSSHSTELAEEILRFGNPVRVLDARSDHAQIGIVITDIFRGKDQLIVRYTVENRSKEPYAMQHPAVFALQAPKSPVSLISLRNTQIDSGLAKSIRGNGEQPVPVLNSDTELGMVSSGERKPGLLSLRFTAQESEPSVLRVVFPSTGSAPVAITLVI